MIIGVVGKANVGKSTFFKSATLAEVLIANYPFATIDPNKGFGFVRITCVDKDFGKQCNPRYGFCSNTQRFVPVEMIDVAGLVPGAHEGKGMGNKFLDDLRQADVLIHVVDASGSCNSLGEPVVPGSYDPLFDIRFLEVELDMWYLGILKTGWEKFARRVRQENAEISPAIAKQLSGLNVTEEMVSEAIRVLNLSLDDTVQWTDEDLHNLAVFLRKKTKPMIIAANKTDVPTAKANIERMKKEFPDYLIIPCSSEGELALREAAKKNLIKYLPGDSDFEIVGNVNDTQRNALNFIKEKILKEWGKTGVQDCLNKAVFDFLGFIAIFPGGVNNLVDKEGRVLPDCFLIKQGATALDFAYKLHTDLGNNFVTAINVKTKQRVGRDYILKHRDVIEIVSGK
ncbi:redox-regulated ATPase YchF [Candidatus Woesearchaeota archaeon]|nr:redox-regulated ATPase YchF [Candidatus Woesearchaeota archaeon]